jgi:hypothetical protein
MVVMEKVVSAPSHWRGFAAGCVHAVRTRANCAAERRVALPLSKTTAVEARSPVAPSVFTPDPRHGANVGIGSAHHCRRHRIRGTASCVRTRAKAEARTLGFRPQRARKIEGLRRYEACFTSGGFHVPSRMDGAFSEGQYNRIIRTNASDGAGSQFCSLSLPGESCWM